MDGDGNGNGLRIKTPVAEVETRGRWGAILLLVVATCAGLLGVSAWGAYNANANQRAATEANIKGHDSIVSLLQAIKYAEEQSQCLGALPIEGEERIAALRSTESPCYYVLYVYAAKTIKPATPRRTPETRAPGDGTPPPAFTPDREPDRPRYPTTGIPARPR